MWSSELLRGGLRWNVTNDKSALFWNDKWVGDKKLSDQRLQAFEGDEAERKVHDYWNNGQRWR